MIQELYKKGGQMTAFFNALFPVFFITFALTPIVAIGQSKNLDIVFYNVENLFDTIDNPETYDEDFTPYGKLSYDTERYQTKLNHISKVVSSVIPNRHPDIIGLSEVENKRVLEDLIQILPKANWKIVHIDSPDGRGIDNAVIYDQDRVEVLESLAIRVDLGANDRPTRDILQVIFADKYAKEELVIFVNHWPSRYGGEIESNWKRVRASQTLQATIKRLDEPSESNFIVLGDFNDNPDNESVMGLTNCDTGLCLENLYEQFDGTENGTCVYKGKWDVLDQILVSKNMIDGSSAYTVLPESVGPYKSDFMLYEDKKSGKKFPNRTYGGPNYYGGYSDHLPVKLTLVTKS